MFYILTLMFALFSLPQGFSEENVIIPCKIDDNACMIRSANLAIPKLLASAPLLHDAGIKLSDPLKMDFLEADVSILNAKFFNNTITGFSKCIIKKLNLNLKAATLRIQLICPSIKMEGDYEISGELITLPIEGKGAYIIQTKTYQFDVAAEVSITKDNNGIEHMHFTKIKSTPKPLESIFFQFDNLFDGNKQLSDNAHKFAHENYEAVAELTQTPIYLTNIKAIFSNVNKYLKTKPLDDLFLK